MKNKQKYAGIIPPLVTPLLPDETLDSDAARKLVDYCISGGVTGLFVNGTSGEAMRLTDRVWEENTRVVIEHTKGRVPVFCGAIDTSTSRTIEKIKKIEAMGGDLAVCTPPFYLTSFGQDEILRHYDMLCNSTDIDIAVYNIPETTHAGILPETAAKLADYEKIVAFKDSTADWQHLQRCMILLESKDIAIFNGAEELCSASLIYGAQGCIPGLANFFPELFVKLYDLCRAGNVAESYELQKKINNVRKCIFVNDCWMSGMKNLIKLLGIGQDCISSPLENLNDQQQLEVIRILRASGIDV